MDINLGEFNHKINNNDYVFSISIISIAGEKTRSQVIKPTAIKSLVITDTFTNIFHTGTIVIDNSFDVIERDTPHAPSYEDPSYYNTGGSKSNIDAGFVFRGESRDILHIEIMPQLESTAVNSLGSEEAQNFYRMTFDFAIYNSEEIMGDKPDQKFKKLFFWDLYYQLLREKNVYFSTATIPSFYDSEGNLNTVQQPSGDEGVETGIALREFLKAAFPDNEGYPILFSQDVPDANSLTQTQIDAQNTDWDIGGTKLFFSSPANYKAIDCIHYILTRHVSNAESEYDQTFLHLNRYPRQFGMKSLKQYFEQAYDVGTDSPGSLYLETIKLGGYTGEDGKTAPEAYFTPAGALYFEKIGTIKSFSFDNMAGLFSQQKLVPHLVHSYDYENKQFNIDITRNGIDQVMQAYQKNYVNKLNSSSDAPVYPSFAPGQLRFTNKNINNVFSLSNQDPDQRLNQGRNKFLHDSILLNNIITFRLPGATHRQSGFFIGIDRDGAIPSSKFDNKMLGIYFIVEVKHVFEGNEYYTDLTCVKTYNYKQLDDTFEDDELKGLVSNGF